MVELRDWTWDVDWYLYLCTKFGIKNYALNRTKKDLVLTFKLLKFTFFSYIISFLWISLDLLSIIQLFIYIYTSRSWNKYIGICLLKTAYWINLFCLLSIIAPLSYLSKSICQFLWTNSHVPSSSISLHKSISIPTPSY